MLYTEYSSLYIYNFICLSSWEVNIILIFKRQVILIQSLNHESDIRILLLNLMSFFSIIKQWICYKKVYPLTLTYVKVNHTLTKEEQTLTLKSMKAYSWSISLFMSPFSFISNYLSFTTLQKNSSLFFKLFFPIYPLPLQIFLLYFFFLTLPLHLLLISYNFLMFLPSHCPPVFYMPFSSFIFYIFKCSSFFTRFSFLSFLFILSWTSSLILNNHFSRDKSLLFFMNKTFLIKYWDSNKSIYFITAFL